MVGIIYNSKSTLGLTDTCGCGEKTEQNKLVMLSVIIERLAIVKHGSDVGCEEVIMLILAEDVDRVTFMSEKSAASNWEDQM